MKICIVSDVFPPDTGGIQTFVYRLAKNLSEDERVEKVSVITFGDKGSIEKLNSKLEVTRIKSRKFNSPKADFVEKSFILPPNLIKKRNYDVLHAITVLPSGFYTTLLSRMFGKKGFVTVFGLDALSGLKTTPSKFLINKVFNNVNKIITFSNFTGGIVAEKYKVEKDKFKTIYPGNNEVNPNKKSRPTEFTILFVGRLVKRKGIDDLIRAIKDLDAKLFVVGDGPEKNQLLSIVKENRVEQKISFEGKVPLSEVQNYYRTADLFCMPSKFLGGTDVEGLGLVFLEAQAHGLPVIGTDCGGIPEAIEDRKSGFVVPQGDINSIREKITMLMQDKELYRSMSKRAVEFVNEKFSWEKCVDEHIKLYESAK